MFGPAFLQQGKVLPLPLNRIFSQFMGVKYIFLAEQIPDTFLVYSAEMVVFPASHQEKAIFRPQVTQKFNFQGFTFTLGTTICFNMFFHKLEDIFFIQIIFGDNKPVMAVPANGMVITG